MSGNSNSKVGYGRPPKQHQFQKGKSGNPKGRPKGSRSLFNILQEELDRKVAVTENGRSQRIAKRRLVARQLANKAAQGELKAIQTLHRVEQTPDDSLNEAVQPNTLLASELTREECWAVLRHLMDEEKKP